MASNRRAISAECKLANCVVASSYKDASRDPMSFCHVSGADLFAKAHSDDMYASIDQLVNKLDAQVKKHKEKLNNHRKN
jgi:ribosomal subunit interface protein